MEAEGDNDVMQLKLELQPGFRFYPTEEELVSFYLHNKLQGLTQLDTVIPVVPVYDLEPWHLPDMAGEASRGDKEQWFFFCPRQEREARGGRPNRTTGSGYWKATGSPGHVYSGDNKTIGIKKTMVFYKGKAPTGRKTKWKMHEYRAIILNNNSNSNNNIPPQLRHEFSLCRVYVVSGAFRAFDRRPLLHLTGRHGNDVVVPSAAVTSAAVNVDADAASTSSQTSDSGGDNNNGDASGGGSTSTAAAADNWNVDDGIIVQEPLWEWDQLNCL